MNLLKFESDDYFEIFMDVESDLIGDDCVLILFIINFLFVYLLLI